MMAFVFVFFFEVGGILLGVARVTEMPKILSMLNTESRVINIDGCRVGTRAWKLMFRRVMFANLQRRQKERWIKERGTPDFKRTDLLLDYSNSSLEQKQGMEEGPVG